MHAPGHLTAHSRGIPNLPGGRTNSVRGRVRLSLVRAKACAVAHFADVVAEEDDFALAEVGGRRTITSPTISGPSSAVVSVGSVGSVVSERSSRRTTTGLWRARADAVAPCTSTPTSTSSPTSAYDTSVAPLRSAMAAAADWPSAAPANAAASAAAWAFARSDAAAPIRTTNIVRTATTVITAAAVIVTDPPSRRFSGDVPETFGSAGACVANRAGVATGVGLSSVFPKERSFCLFVDECIAQYCKWPTLNRGATRA